MKLEVIGGFCGLLFVALVILKVLGMVTFSWFLVFAPLWIPASFLLLIGLACLVMAILFQDKLK